MKKEELTALGLTEEQIKDIFKLRGKELSSHKTKLEEYESKIAKRDEELALLTKNMIKEEDYSTLKTNVDKYKALVEQTKKEYEDKITNMKFDTELEKVLSSSGAKDINLVKSVLDKESIKFEDGKIEGLTEQLEKVKESYGYLFNEETNSNSPRFVSGGKPAGNPGGNETSPFKTVLKRYVR